MNALLHQLRAELRVYRGYFLVWFAFLALHLICVLTGEYWVFHPLKHHPLLAIFRLTSFWLFLAALILSKAAVFVDPPLDPDAFWRTKPLSGRTLMAAKILALGILFVLPVLLIEGVVLVREGGFGVVAAVAVDHLLVRWPAMVIVLGLAALAGSPMRLLGLVIGALLAVGVVTGVLSHITVPIRVDYTPTLIASRFLVAGACAWVGSVTVLYLLYHCGQNRRARALACVTAGLLGVTFLAWPIDFYRRAPDAAIEARLERVAFALHGATSTPAPYGPVGAHRLELKATLTQPDAPFIARLNKARVELGSSGATGGWGQVSPDYSGGGGALETAEQIALLGLPNPSPASLYDISLRHFGGPPADPFPAITVAAGIDLYEQVPVGELVLEAGRRLRLGHGEIEILGLAWAPNKLLIDVREKVLQPMFALRGPVAVLPRSGPSALWTLVVPSTADGTPSQFSRSDAGAYVPPGQNEQSMFSMFRYRHHQLRILRLSDEPNSVELIKSYRGRSVQVYQRMYRGTVRRMATLTEVTLSAPKEGH